MKKWLWAFLLVLSLASGTAFSQVVTVQSSTTLNATTQASNPINLVGTGTTSFTFTWNTTGTVSAGACRLEWSNVSGPPWTQLVAPVTVTSSGGPSNATMVVNYVRFNCTTPITGTGSVQFRYVGTMTVGASGTGQDVNITNPSLVVTQSNAANLNATVTGTITANAGTGFTVAQGSTTAGQVGGLFQCAVTTAAPTYTTGQTNPCSMDTTGALRVTGAGGGGGGVNQGSMTSGQQGTLIQGAATTAAPTYTTGTTNPLSLDLTGALRVNVVAGGAAGGTSSSFTAAFPATGTAAGFSDGTNMQGARVYDVHSGAPLEYVQGVNLRLTGAAGSVEFGTATAPIRTDPTGTTAQPVTGSGNFTVVQPTGTNLHAVMDAGSTTAVTQATAANLNATVVQPTGTNLHVVVDSAPTTAVTGTVTANAGTGFAAVAQGSTTAGQSGQLTMGAVTTAAPSYTSGQTSPLSLDLTGALRVNVVGGAASGGTSSAFGAGFPATGTAVGFFDGSNMQSARVFDADTGGGTQYVQGVNLRLSGAGGSVELGTATTPIRTDTTGTTVQPVSGTITANAGTGNFNVAQAPAVSASVNMQSGATGVGNGTVLGVDGMAVAHLTGICTVSCTTPTIFTLEAQNDGANFGLQYGTQDGTNTIASTFTLSGTTPVYVTVPLHGVKQLRARISTYGAGTITIVGTTSAAAGNPPPVVNANIVNTGAVATNLQSLNGTTIDTNTGNASAGTQRFVLATNQPNLTTPLNVSINANASTNLAQIAGSTVATVGAGVQKVAIVDSTGVNILATADPCSGSNVATFTTATTAANTPVALVTATAGQVGYICGIHIQGNTANDVVVSIVEGTGGTCGGGTPTALDGNTTASNGFRVAGGGGGFTTGFGGATVYKTPSANREICGTASTTDRVIFSGTFIKQ